MSPRKKTDNTLHIAILGFFVKKPNYGYDLYKSLSNEPSFNSIWHLKQSQFYAILDNFYQDGYLKIELQAGGNYPDRKEYQLTEAGKLKFQNWVISPVFHGREMRQEFLAKLYFAIKISKENALILIRNQKEECSKWIENHEDKKSSIDSFFGELMSNYRTIQMQGMLEWLNRIEERIIQGGSDRAIS